MSTSDVVARVGAGVIIFCALAPAISALVGCGVTYRPNAEVRTGPSAPLVRCSSSPTSLTAGSVARISSRAFSPSGLPLVYSYSATAGTLTNEGNWATLNTQGTSGNIVVTCQVVDSKGRMALSTTAVAVEAVNAVTGPPTISCSANPATVTLGGSSTITATGTSPEGRALTYSFSAASGTITATGTSANLNTTGGATGADAITCKVADDQGRSASATTSVTVNAVTTPPTISCSANPATVTLGGSSTITATGTSPEGRPLTYTFSAVSGTITATGTSATLNTTGGATGANAITCKVADDQGRSASATTSVTVNAVTTPPTISCSANPATVTLGGSSTITATGTSPEGRPLTYTFSAVSGTITATGTSATLNTTGGATGANAITCKVADDQGRSASATTSVTVNAVTTPPTISCSANPNTVTLGASSTITATGSSPEGRPLTYSFSAASGTITATGTSANLNTTGGATGADAITCKVADDQGRSASATTSVTVNAVTTPPTISCSANPATVTLGGSSTINATGSSPEGRPLTYSFSAASGTITATGTSANLNTTGGATGADAITCKVADDQGRSASATTSVTVNAVTTPPTISCSANPATVTLGGSSTITATGSSPEGRPLTYSFSAASGTITATGTSANLNTTGGATGADAITCKVADDQGRSASATTSVTVNAVTTPPTISCSANPATVTLGGSSTITATGSSPEGRPLTYTFSAASGTITATGTSATLNTTGGDTGADAITCKVADDQGRSASATTSVTVNAAASAFLAWTSSSLVRIGQIDDPGTVTSISLYAAKNETYSFQVGIRAPASGLTHVNVTASALTGANGAVIAESNIAFFRESYINVTGTPPYYWTGTATGTNPPSGPGLYADGLIPVVDPETGAPAKGGTLQAFPFSLDAGLNQPVWVDVSVPSGTAAGTYTGTLTIASDQADLAIPMTLQVWNFTLPVVPSLKTSFQATNGSNQTLAMSHELLRERVSPDWEEGSNEQTLVTQWGLTSTNLWFSSGLDINNCSNATMPAAPSVAQFQTAVAQHQKNILLYNFTADEIGGCTQLFPTLIQWAANMHQAGLDNLVTVQPVPALENDGTGTGRSAVDIWTVLPLEWDNAQTATGEMTKVLNKGDTVWSYNVLVQDGYSPKMEINFDPLDYRIAVGFISQNLGITGFQQWSVDQWTSDPWNVMTELNNVPSDGLLVYPGPYVGLVGVAPSMRLKWLRDGVDDFEYVQILKGLGQGTWALQQAATVGQDWHTWTRSPADIEAVRIALGNKIDQLSTPSN